MPDTDPAVELVAQALVRTVDRNPDYWRANREDVAAEILAALADRLLPPVVQTREEKGWWKDGKVQTWWSFPNDGRWREPDRVRTITTHTDGSERIGAWRAVEGSEG